MNMDQSQLTLRSTLFKRDLGLKNVRLRFSFWAHMLLSWVYNKNLDKFIRAAYNQNRHITEDLEVKNVRESKITFLH